MAKPKSNVTEMPTSDSMAVDLGRYGVVYVHQMRARDWFRWSNQDHKAKRTEDGGMEFTFQKRPEKLVFESLARSCTSADDIVIDREFLDELPGPIFQKLLTAFLKINELEGAAEAKSDDVGNSETIQ